MKLSSTDKIKLRSDHKVCGDNTATRGGVYGKEKCTAFACPGNSAEACGGTKTVSSFARPSVRAHGSRLLKYVLQTKRGHVWHKYVHYAFPAL
jgi:hypothetical protein